MSCVSGQVASVEGDPHESDGPAEAKSSLGEVPRPGACPPDHILAPFPEINVPVSVPIRTWSSFQGVGRPGQWE
ncbi:hypothetical protein PAL_GLEAN10011739 [Pteropus alecto]|uniref:Uncharacterized protein n=1 Tax=Pteropus alecto TaxID=9402 RepID=L5KGK1_PTEAL|nr:hypothetical protein PAL_GLEAN10011739 [Pteropus alecto]